MKLFTVFILLDVDNEMIIFICINLFYSFFVYTFILLFYDNTLKILTSSPLMSDPPPLDMEFVPDTIPPLKHLQSSMHVGNNYSLSPSPQLKE